MEYVEVEFPEERDVNMDGQIVGKSNSTLMVEEGHHVFDLGEPLDYDPESQEVAVTGTDPLNPLIVIFTQQVG